MEWKVIDKSSTKIPESGTYRDWKEILAEEGSHQCVYCCIHEAQFGGLRNFHVEHYRPKVKYPTLVNIFTNLFYACGICNLFKSDDWPADPSIDDFSYPHYPDPSKVNWSLLLNSYDHTGAITCDQVTGRYLIERLYLNRPQMIINRRLRSLVEQISQVKSAFDELLTDTENVTKDQAIQIAKLLSQLLQVFISMDSAIPYKNTDIQRNKVKSARD